ncbi:MULTISPECIES: hypothetical protein [Sphingomonas]|nr:MULTISPECIES: hypothetical protein [Sphingomonas]
MSLTSYRAAPPRANFREPRAATPEASRRPARNKNAAADPKDLQRRFNDM